MENVVDDSNNVNVKGSNVIPNAGEKENHGQLTDNPVGKETKGVETVKNKEADTNTIDSNVEYSGDNSFKVLEEYNSEPYYSPCHEKDNRKEDKNRNATGRNVHSLQTDIRRMDSEVRRTTILSPLEIAKNKSIYSYNLDKWVQSDLVELKNQCIKLENKSSIIEETINTIRNDFSHNSNVSVNEDIEVKIINAVEEAMIPIQKKVNGNEDMLKYLLSLVNTGMKATLENLISLSSWLENNKDSIDLPTSSQHKGLGTRTRSKVQKNDDPDLMKLKENVATMRSQLVEAESFLNSL